MKVNDITEAIKRLGLAIPMIMILFVTDVVGKPIDRSTFNFLLSKNFTEVERSGVSSIKVKMMEGICSRTVSRKGEVGDQKIADPGSSYTINMGDTLRFGIVSVRDGLEVSVTNGSYRIGRVEVPDRFGASSMLVVFDETVSSSGKLYEVGNVRHRIFVLDVSGGELYNAERNVCSAFPLPFRSIWKDWDDYVENFSDIPKADFTESSHETAKMLCRQAERSQTVRDFCLGLTNDKPIAVRYWADSCITNFALVRKREAAFDVLGVAEIRHGGEFRIYMLDNMNHLLWHGEYSPYGKGRKSVCEFNAEGTVRRFVELDGRGLELPRRHRRFKTGRMLVPSLRAAFLAEAEAVFRPLRESWTNNCYATVFNIPPPSPEDARRMAIVESNHTKWEQRVQDKCARINAVRRGAGQPELTELEKRMIVRGEIWELGRKRFEKLRHERTGCFETTAFDKAIDWERVRLSYLADKISVYNDLTSRTFASRPETLRDLLGVKFPPRGDLPLLLDGEKDIRDQWGKDYRYHAEFVTVKVSGMKWPVIISAGPDGVFDTLDDISSLDEFKMRGMEIE